MQLIRLSYIALAIDYQRTPAEHGDRNKGQEPVNTNTPLTPASPCTPLFPEINYEKTNRKEQIIYIPG